MAVQHLLVKCTAEMSNHQAKEFVAAIVAQKLVTPHRWQALAAKLRLRYGMCAV